MRKDSTILIRKYLEQISQLETDLGQFKRQNKELHNQLKEARDDLQKDEEIFEEKMKEMKDSLTDYVLLRPLGVWGVGWRCEDTA